jgi:hypothetical protein
MSFGPISSAGGDRCVNPPSAYACQTRTRHFTFASGEPPCDDWRHAPRRRERDDAGWQGMRLKFGRRQEWQ